MGWFSKHINGGDEPMDYSSEIAVLCGYNDEEMSSEDFITREKLNEVQEQLFANWKKEKKVTIIGPQMLAYLIVEKGAKFANEEIFNKCVECLKQDDWAEESFERWYHINYLLEILKKYDNKTPTAAEDGSIVQAGRLKNGADNVLKIYEKHFVTYYKLKPEYVKGFSLGIATPGSYVITIMIDESKMSEKNFKKLLEKASGNEFNMKVVFTF